MFEEILIDQNPHWVEKSQPLGWPREQFAKLLTYLNLPQIIAITGIRRCGKSTLLKQVIYHLIEEAHIPAQNILFINLEQPYLLKFNKDINNLESIFQTYLSLKNPTGSIYVLLDEIQFFKDWPVFIKAHYENKKEKVKFIITGSNSSLLSSEMVTLLSGRALPLELYPLSFKEIASIHNLAHKDKTQQIANRTPLKRLLRQTLNRGGFPEIVALKEADPYTDILAQYARTIILQDIAPRLNIRKSRLLEELFTYLATNLSTTTSYSKLSRYFALSDKSIKDYMQAFTEAYLLFALERFSYSVKPQHRSYKKNYSVDCGMANACGFKFVNNDGRLLENAIFIDCKQRGLEVFFYKTKNDLEVDFIIKSNNELTPVQVAWRIDDENTFKREVRALSTALDELKLNKGVLITMTDITTTPPLTTDNRLSIIPAYQWLLR